MSDDDWDIDEEELDKRMEQQKKKNDSSESEEEEKPAWQVEQQSRPKAKPKPKVKAEFYVPLEDAAEEKKRRQKAVEDADLRLAEDLFAGIDKPEAAKEEEAKKTAAAAAAEAKPKPKPKQKTVVIDAFDKVELKTQAHVDNLSAQCLEKINSGKAKNAGAMFLTHLFKAVEEGMDLKDLQAVDKTLTDILKLKKAEKAEANTKVAKAQNITKTSGVNVHDEMSTVYGGGDWDEWDDDDWAEWEAQEGKKAAAKAAAKAKAKAKGKASGPSDLALDFPKLG